MISYLADRAKKFVSVVPAYVFAFDIEGESVGLAFADDAATFDTVVCDEVVAFPIGVAVTDADFCAGFDLLKYPNNLLRKLPSDSSKNA